MINAPSSLKTISQASVLLLILLLPLSYAPFLAYHYQSTKIVLLQFIVITLSSFLVLHTAINKKISFKVNMLDVSMLLRLSVLGIMLALIPNYSNGLESLKMLTLLTVFYFTAQIILNGAEWNGERSIKLITQSLVAAAIIQTVIASTEYIATFNYASTQYSYDKPFVFGTLGSPNSVSWFLSACIPFFILLFKNAQSKSWKIILSLLGALTFLMIILLKSRTSWIALSVGLAVLFLPAVLSKIRMMTRKGLSLLAVPVFILVVVCSIFVFNMNKESAEGRLFVWQAALEMIKDAPIVGIGYGNFPVKYFEYQGKLLESEHNAAFLDNAGNVKQAHNEYFEILAETGIIGFIIFAFIVYQFLSSGCKFFTNKYGEDFVAARAYYASGVIILMQALFDSPFHSLPLYFFFVLNCAIVSLYLKKIEKGSVIQSNSTKRFQVLLSHHSVQINKPVGVVLVAISLFILGFNICTTYGNVTGYIAWQDGIEHAQREDWSNAVERYEKAKTYFPHDGKLLFNLGGAYLNAGKPLEAISILKQASRSFQDQNLLISLGIAYQETEQYAKAEQTYNELIFKFPNLLLPHLILGKLYLDSDRQEEAKKHLHIVLAIKPKFQNEYAVQIKDEAVKLLEQCKDIR